MEQPKDVGNPQLGWVSDLAAEMLRCLGIRFVAINPGASYRGLHDSLVNYLGNRDPQLLLCLHEDHAVSIAHGYARATGEPMGCVLHSNVGLMHGLMGIFNAWCNRLPMLVIGATGPVDAVARRPWIDWIHTSKDQGALLRNFVKWDDEPRSAEAMVESFCRAMVMTRTMPCGPVYVCLDAGLQEAAIDAAPAMPELDRFSVPAPPPPSARTIEEAAGLLGAAKRPVILVGRMSRDPDDWERRIRLAERLGALVVTDLKTNASFPTQHPLHVGPAGLRVQPAAAEVLKEADVILALDWIDLGGTFKAVFGHKDEVKASVVACSLDSYLHNGWSMDLFALAPVDVPILAAPDLAVAALLDALGPGKGKPATAPVAPAASPASAAPGAASSPLRAADIGAALERVRQSRKITLSNVCLGWDANTFPLHEPLDFLGHDGGGGLGSAPGAAIGAALGLVGSGRSVVCVLGDGDFLQGATALWTAAHYRIPVLWIVANNRSNFNDEAHQAAMARQRSRSEDNKWIGLRIDDPAIDFAGLARDQGVAAEGPVRTAEELENALARALNAIDDGRPYLVDVHTSSEVYAPATARTGADET